MLSNIRKYPDWVLKYKRKGTAIHKIGNNYYLYEVTSKWDRKLKRAKKITKRYLGVITPDGLREPGYKLGSITTLKEYGVSSFLSNSNKEILEALRRDFPHWWKELFVLSAIRVMHRAPFKHMAFHYEDSWLSEEFKDVRLHEKSIHKLLEEVGGDRASIVEFLQSFFLPGESLLIDLTHVFSLSEEMVLTSKGYNSEFKFTPQVNLLFIFSLSRRVPLFYRVLLGNVRDVKTLKATIGESGMEDVIIIGDKGFCSKENIKLLEEEDLRYILPLKRDSSLIDYIPLEKEGKRGAEGYFSFNERYIWYYRSKRGDGVWVYLDEHLRVREQEDYLGRIESHPEEYREEGFYKNLPKFGTIALITNMKELQAEKVYQYFKSRSQIEGMFDIFKNILQADRSYMRTDRSMETWMFLNYLAITYYYKIYNLLIEREMLGKYSPLDVLLYLSKICKVKAGEKWIELEIPKQTKKLIEKLVLPIT